MPSNQALHRVTRGGLAPWQVRQATRLLLSENPADHDVTNLARACGLSRSHFSRAFKASTGFPPRQWMLRHRVQRAAELLEHTDDSICTIAAHCGFADQSHLTRVFHAMVGASPTDWRRHRRSDIPAEDRIPNGHDPRSAIGPWPAEPEQRGVTAVLLDWLFTSEH
jgi:transcriptional regulator GlxA family with amidase domain